MDAIQEIKEMLKEPVVVKEKNQKMSELAKRTKNPNPYGANKYFRDPREIKCWEYYLKTVQKGSPNARACALKAGYSEQTASNITQHPWFQKRLSKLRRSEMVNKAEKVLEEILDLPNEIEIMTADGMPTGLKKIDPSLINQKRDVAKFIAEKLIKDYEKKPEVAVYQNVSILDIINKFEKKDGAEIRGQVLEAE
jgi:hypothetical protein